MMLIHLSKPPQSLNLPGKSQWRNKEEMRRWGESKQTDSRETRLSDRLVNSYCPGTPGLVFSIDWWRPTKVWVKNRREVRILFTSSSVKYTALLSEMKKYTLKRAFQNNCVEKEEKYQLTVFPTQTASEKWEVRTNLANIKSKMALFLWICDIRQIQMQNNLLHFFWKTHCFSNLLFFFFWFVHGVTDSSVSSVHITLNVFINFNKIE